MINPLALRSLALVSLATICSCNTPSRIAGSMKVTTEHPLVLRIQSPDAAEIRMQVWNRGPGKVRFEQVQPGASEQVKGVLPPAGPEFSWTATTSHLELVMHVDADEATIAYVVRSDRGVDLFMGTQ